MSVDDRRAPTGEPTIETHSVGPDVVSISLRGEHDMANAEELRGRLNSTLESCKHLVVDLSETEFIDSSIVNVLFEIRRRSEETGKRFNLVLGTNGTVEEVLRITDLLAHMNCVGSIAEALAG